MRDFDSVVEGFRLVLAGLGVEENEHTRETPERAARAWWEELCAGLTEKPPTITRFATKVDEMVVLQGIPVHSLCAHHLLPFVGTATVGYIPGTGSLLGLSKLSRLVDHWCRRPQVQEELTDQVADAMAELVVNDDAGGVGVVIRASHMCMSLRGVKHGGLMTTTALRGALLDEAPARDEFLRVVYQGGGQ